MLTKAFISMHTHVHTHLYVQIHMHDTETHTKKEPEKYKPIKIQIWSALFTKHGYPTWTIYILKTLVEKQMRSPI